MPVVSVDVVIVAYNSRDRLRECVEPLLNVPWIQPIVVDNACPDKSYEVVDDLTSIHLVHTRRNGGFAHGCNAGWRAGESPYVLLLNPDALISSDDIARLASDLDADVTVGIVGPEDVRGGREHRLDDPTVSFTRLDVRTGALPAPPRAARIVGGRGCARG